MSTMALVISCFVFYFSVGFCLVSINTKVDNDYAAESGRDITFLTLIWPLIIVFMIVDGCSGLGERYLRWLKGKN